MNDHKKLAHKTEMQVNAQVQREDLKGIIIDQANQKLREIGGSLRPMIGTAAQDYEYVGSAAVHVFRWGEVFKTIDFASQTVTMQDIPEHIASDALQALKTSLQAHYGRDPQTHRSGF